MKDTIFNVPISNIGAADQIPTFNINPLKLLFFKAFGKKMNGTDENGNTAEGYLWKGKLYVTNIKLNL